MSEEGTADSLTTQQAEREAQRTQASRDELVERITRSIREDGTVMVGPIFDHGAYGWPQCQDHGGSKIR
jgi:hypothetical protein